MTSVPLITRNVPSAWNDHLSDNQVFNLVQFPSSSASGSDINAITIMRLE
jgi:hypothetical protein